MYRLFLLISILVVTLTGSISAGDARDSCQHLGNQTYCGHGELFDHFGNETYDRRGNTWHDVGGQTIGPDRKVYQRLNNHTYDSRGKAYPTFGDQTNEENERSCTRTGDMVKCK
jgi:hypothetical protein